MRKHIGSDRDKQSGKQSQGVFKQIIETYGNVFHEWQSEEAKAFFVASGISKRNWCIYMRRMGLADGKSWTLRALADDVGISHVRIKQIADQTAKNLERFAKASM